MPKITSVKPQKKNPRRFNIFLDGQFGFGADEDLVVDHRLVVGKIIESGELEEILFDGEVGKLMERVYGLSNIRMRSEKEIRNYLKTLSFKRKVKGEEEISPIVIESTIDKAINKGLINDLEFAKAWVESRSKKKGPQIIKRELFQKGIDREIIEEVISEQVTGYSQERTAEKLLERKERIWKNLPILEFKKKALDFLIRRGFEYSLSKDVVEKLAKLR
jgi:regulatory protein